MAVTNVIVLVEIAYLFNCRSLNRSVFSLHILSNGWVLVGALGMLVAQLAFTYSPVMNRLFHTAPISTESWMRIFGMATAVFAIVELEKWIRYGRGRGAKTLPE